MHLVHLGMGEAYKKMHQVHLVHLGIFSTALYQGAFVHFCLDWLSIFLHRGANGAFGPFLKTLFSSTQKSIETRKFLLI